MAEKFEVLDEASDVVPGARYGLTPPEKTDDYTVCMRVECRWLTHLKDGTEAEFSQEFEGFPTPEQVSAGAAAVVEFARAQELDA
jgi:hypothetical protein